MDIIIDLQEIPHVSQHSLTEEGGGLDFYEIFALHTFKDINKSPASEKKRLYY